jgi:hypothetical protein
MTGLKETDLTCEVDVICNLIFSFACSKDNFTRQDGVLYNILFPFDVDGVWGNELVV